jgi:hypothetical protein
MILIYWMGTDIYNRSDFDMIEQVHTTKLSAPFTGSKWQRRGRCNSYRSFGGSSYTVTFQITYTSENTKLVAVLTLFLTMKLLQNSMSHAVKWRLFCELSSVTLEYRAWQRLIAICRCFSHIQHRSVVMVCVTRPAITLYNLPNLPFTCHSAVKT